jgi:hypothetical protein
MVRKMISSIILFIWHKILFILRRPYLTYSLIAIGTIASYYPIYLILTTERPRDEIILSTLTVLFVFALGFFGGVWQAYTSKKFAKHSPLFRHTVFIIGIGLIFYYLSLIGYQPRYFFPP